jgi:protein O-mannosyl-transferase
LLGNGTNPAGYHWVNFLLHWTNAVLVFLLGIVLFKDRSPAFLSAALFAVHPVTTEAVTNIAGRADLLSACSILAGLLLYIESKEQRGRISYLALVSLAGVLAKENAVVLVGLMALYDLAFPQSRPVKSAYGVVIASLAVMGLTRWLVFSNASAIPDSFLDNPLLGASFWISRLTAITVLTKDLWIYIWPLHLAPSYSFNQIPMFQWTDWRAVSAVVVIAGLAILTIAMYRWHRTMFFLLGWIFIALLPTANLLTLIGSIMAERFLYLPLVGFAGCLVLFATKVLPKRAAPLLLAVLIAAFGIRTYIRNSDWQDDLHLWTAAQKVAPNSYATHLWLAAALGNKQPLGSEIDRAIAEGEKAAAIVNTLPMERRITPIYIPLAVAYLIKGYTSNSAAEQRVWYQNNSAAEQRVWYQKSLDLLTWCIPLDRAFQARMRLAEAARGRHVNSAAEAGDYKLYENLGMDLLLLGKTQKALDAFLTMQRMAPFNPDAGVRLGDAYLALGQPEQAAISYQQAVVLQPDHADANQRLVQLYPRIDKQGCAIDINKRLNPFCATVRHDMCSAYSRLAEVLRGQNNFDQARKLQNAAVSSGACPAPG